jgi:hypothetical protein
LTAEFDVGRAAPGVLCPQLVGPHVEFDYVVRSRANTHFAVILHKRGDDGLPAYSMASGLREVIRELGFPMLSEEDILKHAPAVDLAPETTDEELRLAFEPLARHIGPNGFLVVVGGWAETHLVQTIPTGDNALYVVHCPWRIRVLDSGLPEGLLGVVLDLRGTGRAASADNRIEAARRALADATADAAEQLEAGLRDRFGNAAVEERKPPAAP